MRVTSSGSEKFTKHWAGARYVNNHIAFKQCGETQPWVTAWVVRVTAMVYPDGRMLQMAPTDLLADTAAVLQEQHPLCACDVLFECLSLLHLSSTLSNSVWFQTLRMWTLMLFTTNSVIYSALWNRNVMSSIGYDPEPVSSTSLPQYLWSMKCSLFNRPSYRNWEYLFRIWWSFSWSEFSLPYMDPCMVHIIFTRVPYRVINWARWIYFTPSHHFSVILPSTALSFKWTLPFVFSSPILYSSPSYATYLAHKNDKKRSVYFVAQGTCLWSLPSCWNATCRTWRTTWYSPWQWLTCWWPVSSCLSALCTRSANSGRWDQNSATCGHLVTCSAVQLQFYIL